MVLLHFGADCPCFVRPPAIDPGQNISQEALCPCYEVEGTLETVL